MKALRAVVLAALCPILFACAAPPKPAPPQPVVVKTPVDGTWRGTSTRFQADSRQCPHPGLVEFVVWKNQFQYRWDYHVYLDATVDPDDTVQGSAPGITLNGKRNGSRMEGDVTNGTCGLHFTVHLVE